MTGGNLAWGRAILRAAVAAGVDHVCISPGSRSTPLTWAAAEWTRDGRLGSTIHIDERSAAFFALGRSRAGGRPTMLVCTSGTAGAHYFPAVIEAHQSAIPLVVVTADRPPELREGGSWQVIDQRHLFGRYVRWFAELATPDPLAAIPPDLERHAAAFMERAVAEAMGAGGRPGPVHLNVPLREPLASPDAPPSAIGSAAATATGSYPDRIQRGAGVVEPDVIDRLARRMAASPRGLILAGPYHLPMRQLVSQSRSGPQPDDRTTEPATAYASALITLADALEWPILAEPTGGIRFGPHAKERVVDGYDALLRADDWAGDPASAPDMTLRFGAPFPWKYVAQYLDRHRAAERVVVDRDATFEDPGRGATLRLIAEPVRLMRSLAERLHDDTLKEVVRERSDAAAGWWSRWRDAAALAADAQGRAMPVPDARQASGGDAADGEPGAAAAATPHIRWVYRTLVERLPEPCLIWAANSMAVRDLDSFAPVSQRRYAALASRGAAGIDGTVSTALGAASLGLPTCLVTGDLAFLHDVNGLAARAVQGPVTVGDVGRRPSLLIVVLDDGGGGIFEHLPLATADRTIFEPYFVTPTAVDLRAAAQAYGVPSERVADEEGLRTVLRRWRETGGVRVVVVPVDRADNTAAHRRYWDAVSSRLSTDAPGRA